MYSIKNQQKRQKNQNVDTGDRHCRGNADKGNFLFARHLRLEGDERIKMIGRRKTEKLPRTCRQPKHRDPHSGSPQPPGNENDKKDKLDSSMIIRMTG